ncbi:hypothetical protein quinque_007402 [Culex quinquefasciatus]
MLFWCVLVGRLKDTVIEEEPEWMAAEVDGRRRLGQRNGVNLENVDSIFEIVSGTAQSGPCSSDWFRRSNWCWSSWWPEIEQATNSWPRTSSTKQHQPHIPTPQEL